MEQVADSRPSPGLERIAIQVAEHWYRRHYQREALGHVVAPLAETLPLSANEVAVDVIEPGDVPHRVTVTVDSLSGFVHELTTPIACKHCRL